MGINKIKDYGFQLIQTGTLLSIAGAVFGIQANATGLWVHYFLSIVAFVCALGVTVHLLKLYFKQPEQVFVFQ